MDMNEIRQLIDLGDKKGLAEFEVEKSGVRVRIKYNREAHIVQYALPTPTLPANPTSTQNQSPVISAAPQEASAVGIDVENLHVVKSPIVGTFYAASDPKSLPFVKVGDHVKPGQVLCIVEAMKLMNEIESEVSGEVVKILVQNAQPVEYGEALFAIRVS